MNEKDIRWRQRYENFLKAFNQLNQAIMAFDKLSDLEKEGLVQRFEYTFEIAWKTVKDFLESKGLTATFPRDVIKEAFANQVIMDGEVWIEMLNSRNLMAHTYEEEIFNQVVESIHKKYFPAIKQLVDYLDKEK